MGLVATIGIAMLAGGLLWLLFSSRGRWRQRLPIFPTLTSTGQCRAWSLSS